MRNNFFFLSVQTTPARPIRGLFSVTCPIEVLFVQMKATIFGHQIGYNIFPHNLSFGWELFLLRSLNSQPQHTLSPQLPNFPRGEGVHVCYMFIGIQKRQSLFYSLANCSCSPEPCLNYWLI